MFYAACSRCRRSATPDDPEVVAAGHLRRLRLRRLPRARAGDRRYRQLPAYAQRPIRPYTDLLLHDLGPGLADGKRDGKRTPSEWRTPPLWGIGLFPIVNGHSRYLHDGRARDLAEAILWHGGEATRSRAVRGSPRPIGQP